MTRGYRYRGKKITLHDRGLALAEQGWISLGCVFMRAIALRAASGLTICLQMHLMKINEAHALHLLSE